MIPPQPERDLIVALFRRIGEQLELKDEWEKLPNAERSAMAGDFYNIITSHSNTSDRDDPCIECIHIKKELRAERDKVLNRLCEICPLLDERPDICENCVVETVRKELRTPTPEAQR